MQVLLLLLLSVTAKAADDTAVMVGLLELKPNAVANFRALPAERQQRIVRKLVRFGCGEEEVAKEQVFSRYVPTRALTVLKEAGISDATLVTEASAQLQPSDSKKTLSTLSFLKDLRSPAVVDSVGKLLVALPGERIERDALDVLAAASTDKSLPHILDYRTKRPSLPDASLSSYLYALGSNQSKEAADLLLKEYETSKNPKIKFEALSVLSTIPTRHALSLWLPIIVAKDKTMGTPEQRRDLLLASLKQINDSKDKPAQIFLTKEILHREPWSKDSEGVLQMALREVPRLESSVKEVEPEVIAIAQSTKPEDWTFPLIRALGAIHTTATRTELLKFLKTPFPLPAVPLDFEIESKFQLLAYATAELTEQEPTAVDHLATRVAEAFHFYSDPQTPDKIVDHTGNRERLSALFEHVRQVLPEGSSRRRFDEKVVAKVYPESGAPKSPCDEACRLAAEIGKWAKKEWLENPEYWKEDYPTAPWRFAITSLGALFIAKAAPYCKNAQETWTKMLKEWFSTEKPSKEKTRLPALPQLASDVRKWRKIGPLGDKWSVYGNVFYQTLLREIASERGKSVATEKVPWAWVEEELALTNEALRKDVSLNPVPTKGVAGSLFESFALGAAHLGFESPPDASTQILVRLLKNSQDAHPTLAKEKAAQFIPYGPEHPAKESRRAASARVVPVHLALYAKETDKALKASYRKNLLEALRSYSENTGSLMMHIPRNNTHQPAGQSDYDGLAPYYYYPATAYAASAFKILDHDSEVTDQEREELKDLKKETTRKLLLLIKKNELPLSHGSDRYAASQAYNTPLAGLALLALGDECWKIAGQPPSEGIVDSRRSVFTAPAPRLQTNGKERKTNEGNDTSFATPHRSR